MARLIKTMALFMVYLVLTVFFMQGVTANVQVSPATGDVSVNIPLTEVPGAGGLDFPISASYSAGITMEQPSSWLGLGWSLDVGQISRTVMGVPDDNSNSTVFVYHEEKMDDTRSWWERFVDDYLLLVIILVISVVMMIPPGVTLLVSVIWGVMSNIMLQLKNTGSVDWQSVVQGAVISLATAGIMMGLNEISTGSIAMTKAMDYVNTATSAMGCISMAYQGVSLASSMMEGPYNEGSSYSFYDSKPGYIFKSNPDYAGNVYDENLTAYDDGGKPDQWFLGGPYISGRMIIAGSNLNNPSSFTSTSLTAGNNRAKFYLEDSNSPYAVRIDYTTDVLGRIEMFIVTDNTGKKYVYGDPLVSGSREFTYATGSFSKYTDKISHYEISSEDASFLLSPHITSWKLTAILNPDYIDGNGNYNPVDSEEDNKGAWIAFKYDEVYHLLEDSPNCGFVTSNTIDGSFEETETGSSFKSASVSSKSYLSEIISPTHKAVFYKTKRFDEREGKSFIVSNSDNIHRGILSYNFIGILGNTGFCGESNNPCQNREYYCTGNVESTDYPYALTNIELISRPTDAKLSEIYFNKDEWSKCNSAENDCGELYKLRPEKPGTAIDDNNMIDAKNPTGGAYTLNAINICGPADFNCKKTEFVY